MVRVRCAGDLHDGYIKERPDLETSASSLPRKGVILSVYRDVTVAIVCLLVLYAALFLVAVGLMDLTFR
jgi:hypothetical protein